MPMTESAASKTAPRRGRKPLGERSMTVAERKRLSRSRKSEQGSTEFMVRLAGGTLNFIDQYALASGLTRSAVVEAFLDMAIARVGNAVADAEMVLLNGGTDDDAALVMRTALQTTPNFASIEKYKEVMGIK